jgi:hypothetical protein
VAPGQFFHCFLAPAGNKKNRPSPLAFTQPLFQLMRFVLQLFSTLFTVTIFTIKLLKSVVFSLLL